ncbi:unnamed protein product [Victoria cruziana]
MGECSENCSPLDFFDSDDFPKCFSGLSTLLVATIQELKDRISQIEFIFCSQLFPNFETELSKYRSLNKRLYQDMKDAEAHWKQKENSLVLIVEDLRREKQEALDEIPQIQASFVQEKADLVEHFMAEREKLLQAHEEEKNHLLSQVKGLQMNLESIGFIELQLTEEVDRGKKVERKLQEQIKEKEKELQWKESKLKIIQSKLSTEQKEMELLSGRFKKLKKIYFNLRYQYEMLLSRSGFVAESELPCREMDVEFSLLSNPADSPYCANDDSNTSASPCDQHQVKDISVVTEKLDNGKNDKMGNYISLSLSNKTSFPHPHKRPVSTLAEIPASRKRSNTSWRNTRSSQGPGGADPHDDFLDTPLANIQENLKKKSACNPDLKILTEKVQDPLVAPPEHLDPHLEEETQETNPGPACPRQKIAAATADDWSFKYVGPARRKGDLVALPKHIDIVPEEEIQETDQVPACPKQKTTAATSYGGSFRYIEPVRGKGDRQFLNGFECKQCKKFYDAVRDASGIDSNKKIQCEHHDGVSRHRYRYLPPSTPDGFWNIGFDSDA